MQHRAWLTIDVYTHARGEGNPGSCTQACRYTHKMLTWVEADADMYIKVTNVQVVGDTA